MDIRNSLDGLRSLLGVNSPAPSAPQQKGSSASIGSGLDTDRATLSDAASEVSQSFSGEDVRMDKVAAAASALAAGTYSVPASAVASKLVDGMLAGGQ